MEWDGSGMKDEGSGSEGVMGDGYYISTLCHSHPRCKNLFSMAGPCLLHVVSAVSDHLPRRSPDPKNQSDLATLDMVSLPVPVISIRPLFFYFIPARFFHSDHRTAPSTSAQRGDAASSRAFHPLRTDPSLHTTLSPVGISQRL